MSDAISTLGVRAWRWYGLALVVIAIDQITKHLVVANMTYGEVIPYTSFFNLVSARNYGAAFSLLADAGGWQHWFFLGVAGVVSVGIVVWLWKLPASKKLEALALGLILGGALGNVYDRITLGYVVDFLDFYWGSYHWPAFNMADSAICVGAGLLIWDALFGQHNKGTEQ